jgi:hypothetical protein
LNHFTEPVATSALPFLNDGDNLDRSRTRPQDKPAGVTFGLSR